MKNSIKNNCEQFRIEMWLYLDDALPKEKQKRWMEHLSSCSKCSAELKTAKEQLERLLVELAAPSVGDRDAVVLLQVPVEVFRPHRLGIGESIGDFGAREREFPPELLAGDRERPNAALGKDEVAMPVGVRDAALVGEQRRK